MKHLQFLRIGRKPTITTTTTLYNVSTSLFNTKFLAHRCIFGVKVHHDILLPLERRQSDLGAVLVFHRKCWCNGTKLTYSWGGRRGILVLLLLILPAVVASHSGRLPKI